jgi:subtilisin family serine protease
MQALGQQIPYGVSMIKANAFWSAKLDRGGSAKVCIIDTGLNIGHEDMQGVTVSGSTDSSVVSNWNEDQAGHGSHVAGIIAAMDNSVGVVGVAPEAELYIVRGKNFGSSFMLTVSGAFRKILLTYPPCSFPRFLQSVHGKQSCVCHE